MNIYCIGRIIEIREGYATEQDKKPRVIKLSMEPNPYTPSMTMEIMLAKQIYDDLKIEVGQRIKITLSPATEAEWESFQSATKAIQAVKEAP